MSLDHQPSEIVQVSRAELEAICRKVAQEGVKDALESLGLNDAKDIYEIKSIVEAWRAIRTSMFQTVGKVVTTIILASIAAGVVINGKWFS
jgi:hypothetical protein